jgi:hypothetical protein
MDLFFVNYIGEEPEIMIAPPPGAQKCSNRVIGELHEALLLKKIFPLG